MTTLLSRCTLFLLFLLLVGNDLIGQSTGSLIGRVVNEAGEPLIGAYLSLTGTDHRVATDVDGSYRIRDVPFGAYTLDVTYVGSAGYQENVVVDDREVRLNLAVADDAATLAEAVVTARSRSREVSELPMTITSLDARLVSERALGAEELLKTSSGVVVRQQGGLGGAVNVNLNGLSGQAVRVYYDGIPLELFGGGLLLNTVPVDALSRIDVFKGIMPVDIGTDALGGGINLVPKRRTINTLSTAYTIGSFNTHRLSLSGNYNLSERFSLSLLSYYNYSDNDFVMRNIASVTERRLSNGVVVAGPEEFIDARRFHDRHQSAYAEATLGIRDVKWADRLDFVTAIASRNDQIQHGAFLFNTAVGQATRANVSLIQRVDYRKKFWNDRLNVRYYGTLSTSRNEIRDSSTTVYNWRGERLQTAAQTGAELFPQPTRRDGNDLGTAHRLTARAQLSDRLNFSFSQFYGYLRIEGEDPAGPRLQIGEDRLDPNTVPSVLTRNIFGAELTGTFAEERGTAVAFYKNYYYSAESIDILQRNATRLPVRNVDATDHGFGLALKYQLTPRVFLRSSFERAVRLPTEIEIFGDFAAVVPNYTLRPEKSNNLNVGLQYDRPGKGGTGALLVRLDGFIRDQEDLIRADAFGPENSRFVNEAEVNGRGAELTLGYQALRRLRLATNFTYQTNLIQPGTSDVGAVRREVQVPNVPRLFYNASARYTIPDILAMGNDLELFWTYFYTARFSINEVADLDSANPTFVIPAQNLHNAGLTYRLPERGITVSANLQNVFNAEVFDNFRIPRPGRHYQFKIGYTLQ